MPRYENVDMIERMKRSINKRRFPLPRGCENVVMTRLDLPQGVPVIATLSNDLAASKRANIQIAEILTIRCKVCYQAFALPPHMLCLDLHSVSTL